MCDNNNTDSIIIPQEKAIEIIKKANKIFLRKCPCRTKVKNCPPETWEVCLLFENASKKDLKEAHPIEKEHALSILQYARDNNLINRLFYTIKGHYLTEICNCCSCCCSPILRIKKDASYEKELKSNLIAFTNHELCKKCGLCQEICVFDARKLEDGRLIFVEGNCFGCNLCVNNCPMNAISLKTQTNHGIPIPEVIL